MTYSDIVYENAKVMAKGQVTLPKEIRDKMNIKVGDKVSFVYDGEKVVLMNPAILALRIFQEEMKGTAKELGIESEDSVVGWLKDVRKETQ